MIIIFALTLFGVIAGGSLLYVFITYPPSYIFSRIAALDFSFLKSGLVFYGGLIGGAAGLFAGAAFTKTPVYMMEEDIIPVIPVCHAIGRIGCLLAGCCYSVILILSFKKTAL